MQVTPEKNEKVAKMTFASVYPHYVSKIESKGKTLDELHTVIEWLTGYNSAQILEQVNQKVNFETFFVHAKVNPKAHLIKGVICGYRIENIKDQFMVYKQVRYLDKLVDELAKGKKLEKILRA